MVPRPSSLAIRRMVTASRPSASASATAAAAIAPRLYRAFGPRPPCSGSSQMDGLISITSPGARAYRRAAYVVSCRQQQSTSYVVRGAHHDIPDSSYHRAEPGPGELADGSPAALVGPAVH